MAGSMTDSLEVSMLNHILRNVAFTSVANTFLSLHTASPGETGSLAAEVSGGAYARQSLTFAAAAARAIGDNTLVTFPTATASWGTVTHFGINSAVTAGTMYFHGDWTTSRVIGVDDIAKVLLGDLDVSYSAGGVRTDISHSWLNKVLRNIAFVPDTTWFVALYTTAPGDAAAGVEVTGGAYARQAVVFAAPAGSPTLTDNTLLLTFPQATASWGTVVAHAVVDAVTVGQLLTHAAMDTSKLVSIDDTAKIAVGDLNLTAV